MYIIKSRWVAVYPYYRALTSVEQLNLSAGQLVSFPPSPLKSGSDPADGKNIAVVGESLLPDDQPHTETGKHFVRPWGS